MDRIPQLLDKVLFHDADARDCPGFITCVWEPATALTVNVYTLPVSEGDVPRKVRKALYSEEPKEGTWRYLTAAP